MADPIKPPEDESATGNEVAKNPANAPPSAARRFVSRIIDVTLWIAVAGVIFLAVYPKKSGPHVGEPAAVHRLPTVGEASQSTRAIPGELKRPLLIEAFASWCGACRRSSGVLDDLRQATQSGKLDVVAISVDDDIRKALAAKKSWPIDVNVLHDASGKFSRDYDVSVLPTFVLIGVDGTVKRVTSGSPGASDIRAWLLEAEAE